MNILATLLLLAIAATFGWILDLVMMIRAEVFRPGFIVTTIILGAFWWAALWSHRKHRRNREERLNQP